MKAGKRHFISQVVNFTVDFKKKKDHPSVKKRQNKRFFKIMI